MEKKLEINDEQLHKEIDLIQDVIKRMAHNSFLLKGWLISLIAIILALTEKNVLDPKSLVIYLILCLPILMFWYLDAFFIKQERLYRKLYEWVIFERLKGNIENQYALNPQSRFKADSIIKTMFSITLRLFYGIPFLFCVGMFFYK